LAVALAGLLLFLAVRNFQQPVHHWHPSNSNYVAVCIVVYFQPHMDISVFDFSVFWKE